MKKTICAVDYAKKDLLVIAVKTDLPDNELKRAVKAAAREFILSDTTEARTAMSATEGRFNWTDACLWIPDGIQLRHGFLIAGTSHAAFVTNHDEDLIGS